MRHRTGASDDPPPEDTRTGAPVVRQPPGKPGVLVVDDDRLVRLMVQLGLERYGFEVCLAPDGRQAIELYREQGKRISVVLLDVRMPGLDGPATLDALRALNADVQACFMSGDPGEYERAELLRRGAAYVIAKPFQLDQLAHVLRLLAYGVPGELVSSGAGGRGEPIGAKSVR